MKKVLFGICYWLLQLTWGCITTIIGFLVTIFCIIFLKGKPHKNGFSYIVEIGNNWGGLELGAFALCSNYSISNPKWYEHTRRHEFGHSLQNIIFGPLYIFVVGIPSAIRYWYNVIAESKGKRFASDWYDSIWFEGTATKWGTKIVNYIENKN